MAGSKVVSRRRVFVFAAGKLRLYADSVGPVQESLCTPLLQLKNGTFCIIEQERGGNSSAYIHSSLAVAFLSFMFCVMVLAFALLCAPGKVFSTCFIHAVFHFPLPLVSYERTLCWEVITFWFVDFNIASKEYLGVEFCLTQDCFRYCKQVLCL